MTQNTINRSVDTCLKNSMEMTCLYMEHLNKKIDFYNDKISLYKKKKLFFSKKKKRYDELINELKNNIQETYEDIGKEIDQY